jgi:ABC-type multidrug transport system fused ATPase/permease subunit
MTFGSLVAFISYSALVFEPIKIVSYLIRQISNIKPAFERYLEFLNADAEKDSLNAIKLSNSIDIKHIKFENVSLNYNQKKALDNVSFTINKGENVAIIGFNGSGKTSIINLFLRFYEPSQGYIKINNENIKSFTFESYRSIWSLMAQSNYLFNDSIKNNINITEDLTMNQIKNSCKISGAGIFIHKLQDKFDTCVGYNGALLSGGEKQKVVLARTLARKHTKILLLDEATSSYDYYSEQIFNKEILSTNCYDFTIIITHRPEVLKKLDKIIYLDKGKVVDIGTFDELYKSQKGFRNMITNKQEEKINAI